MTKKGWLIATVLTFITICAWVIFDILHARSQVEIPAKTQEAIEPISPEFNIKALDSIPESIEPQATTSASNL